jgi:hypothetical protein
MRTNRVSRIEHRRPDLLGRVGSRAAVVTMVRRARRSQLSRQLRRRGVSYGARFQSGVAREDEFECPAKWSLITVRVSPAGINGYRAERLYLISLQRRLQGSRIADQFAFDRGKTSRLAAASGNVFREELR